MQNSRSTAHAAAKIIFIELSVAPSGSANSLDSCDQVLCAISAVKESFDWSQHDTIRFMAFIIADRIAGVPTRKTARALPLKLVPRLAFRYLVRYRIKIPALLACSLIHSQGCDHNSLDSATSLERGGSWISLQAQIRTPQSIWSDICPKGSTGSNCSHYEL